MTKAVVDLEDPRVLHRKNPDYDDLFITNRYAALTVCGLVAVDTHWLYWWPGDAVPGEICPVCYPMDRLDA